MAIFEILTAALAPTVGKILIKAYFGDTAADLSGSLMDLAAQNLRDRAEQRRAVRLVEDLTDQVIAELVPVFETEGGRGVAVEAIAHELAATLASAPALEVLLRGDLAPPKVTRAYRQARSLPESQFSAAEVAFYDRALQQTVHHLTAVAHKLPSFDGKATAESLQRLSALTTDTGRIRALLEDFRAERVHQQESEVEQVEQYEKRYRSALVRNLNYVELLGFGHEIRRETKDLPLSVAYISLSVATYASTTETTEPIPFATLLDRLRLGSGRLLILGEAGSGKTTLFRCTAIEAARELYEQLERPFRVRFRRIPGMTRLSQLDDVQWRQVSTWIKEKHELESSGVTIPVFWSSRLADVLKDPADLDEIFKWFSASWRGRIPFLIRLRNCQQGKLPKPGEFPGMLASEIGDPPDGWVESVLRDKRGFILLDGIDEIPNIRRDDARRAMEALMREYEGNYFLISSRPAAVEEGWFTDLDMEHARVNPMSDVDREQFIGRWHEAVAAKLGADADPNRVRSVGDSLSQKLRENPPIRRLASNPLLCGAICALHYFRNEFLPGSQRELCETLCHLLIHRREVEGGLRLDEYPEAYRTLTYDHKKSIIQDFAHYMVLEEEPTLNVERAHELTAKALKTFPGRKEEDAQEVCKGLVERSGVLRQASTTTIDFIHNTLKEFMAAEHFVADRNAGLLAKRAVDPSWTPVVLFAAACADQALTGELITKILDVAPVADL